MKTFNELLTELKASTLGSYIGKAVPDYGTERVTAFATDLGSTERKEALKKMIRRQKGIKKATDKLVKGDYQKEDIESAQQGRYYHEETETVNHPVGERPKGIGWSLKKAGEQTGKKYSVWERKTKKVVTNPPKTNEDIDQVDEASSTKKATVDTQKYDWGTMKVVRHGHDFSIPLHPEHHQAIAKLKHGETHNFKDETNRRWSATRDGDKVHFLSSQGGTHKTSVPHHTMKEDVESAQRDLDAKIAAIIEKRALEIENISYIDEVLTKSDPAEKWIHDFVHSDNPKFRGKTKEERRKMAIGAYYGKQREK